MRVLKNTLSIIFLLLSITVYISIFVVYIWSLKFGYDKSFLALILTAIIPIFAQGYWLLVMINEDGVWSGYPVSVYIVLLSFILLSMFSVVMKHIENKTSDDSGIIELGENPKPYGFGGWLIFFTLLQLYSVYSAINLVINDALPAIRSDEWSELTNPSSDVYSPVWNVFITVEFLQAFILPALFIFIIYLTLIKSRHYKASQLIYITVIMIFSIVATIVYAIINDRYEQELYDVQENVYRTIIFGLLWYPYFIKSRRITNTYNR